MYSRLDRAAQQAVHDPREDRYEGPTKGGRPITKKPMDWLSAMIELICFFVTMFLLASMFCGHRLTCTR